MEQEAIQAKIERFRFTVAGFLLIKYAPQSSVWFKIAR